MTLQKLEHRLTKVELQLTNSKTKCRDTEIEPESSGQTAEVDIILERLRRVEESMDERKPHLCFSHKPVGDLWDRLDEVESTSYRFAEDTLCAVQGIHAELAELRLDLRRECERRSNELEARLMATLTNGVDKISLVLRKLVSVQKSLSRQPGTVNST